MRRHRLMAVALTTLATMIGLPGRAEIGWEPSRTWVFAVGILEWEHADIYRSFPDAMPNRADRRLVAAIKGAGVPDHQVVFLMDEKASLAAIRRAFKSQLDRTKEGDLLIFYFAGHGSRDRETRATYFANYDAGSTYASHWPVKEIFDTINDRFSGDHVIMMADCCHSGAMVDEARKRQEDLACACLTSSSSHNSSTGSWTFTEAMVKGFEGSPWVDADADGEIEVQEMALYAELDMAFLEHQKAMFIATDDFDSDLAIADTEGTPAEGLGRHVEVEWKGTWYPAQVIEVGEDQEKVHYVDFDAAWDEWVSPDRVRTPQVPRLPKGTRVEVLWPQDKTWYPATVMASQFGLHKVHYDGYSHEWDDWVASKSVKVVDE